MRFLTVVGARPQFIKAAPLSAVLRRYHSEYLVHTGQHYDDNMSRVFFDELGIPKPDVSLQIGSGSHGKQTGDMLTALEKVFLDQTPDAIILYGDTNTTLAAALAASKLHIPIAHIEAGLRSFNRKMPEEVNRVVTDHLSHWLFAPCAAAVKQLKREGIQEHVYDVGDIMLDSIQMFSDRAERISEVWARLRLEPSTYALATIHRASNTDSEPVLRRLIRTLNELPMTVVLPLHPRTAQALRKHRIEIGSSIRVVEPQGYLDMLKLLRGATIILTDSGGIQKEAYYVGVPCVTLRSETEWTETVSAGWNILAGSDPVLIRDGVDSFLARRPSDRPALYGDGNTVSKILNHLKISS